MSDDELDNDNNPEEDLPDTAPPDSNPNGLHAYAVLGEFLEEDGWHPTPNPERFTYRMAFAGRNGSFSCLATIKVNLQQFLFYVYAPVKVPEEAQMAVAEFLTRANYGLRIGNFEFDYSDGEVRYKTSLDFEGNTLNDEFLRHTIYAAVQTMDRYMPGLMRVIYGGATPFEAIDEIEGNG